MVSGLYGYKNSGIGWCRFGSGAKTVICFHGYGEDVLVYRFLENCAADEFSFYAIDLPFHGQTEWNESESLSVTDLQEIINGIMESDERPTGNFILLGFSLGGRMALALYEKAAATTQKLVLLAPDGLKVNGWYWLATQTLAGMKLFSFTMKNPAWFFAVLRILNGLKLINSSVFKFVKYYVNDPQARQLLYNRWIGLRKIKPHLSLVKEKIRKHETDVRIIYGVHDRIILSSVGQRFKRGIEKNTTITLIESGHQILHAKNSDQIVAALRD